MSQNLIPRQGEAPAAAGPDLSVQLTHTSSFLRGQTNAVYLIRVMNSGGAPTVGGISVVESMPAGITITAMSGPGWSCAAGTCTRNDSFAAGQMLPTISVLATVSANAAASVSNVVTVSGGGDSSIGNNLATDVTSIASEGWVYGFGEPGVANSPLTYTRTALSDVVALAVSVNDALVLRKDGTLVQWDGYGQDTPAEARALTGVVAIAMEERIYYALKSDGTVAAWSRRLLAPDTSGLTNIVAISARGSSALAVRADGSVAAISNGVNAILTLPAGLANVVQLSVGGNLAVALDASGFATSWGSAPALPVPSEPLAQVFAASSSTGAGIRPDGTVVVWQTFPTGDLLAVPSSLSGVTALTGVDYLIALKADGTARGWGTQPFFHPEQANALAQARAVAGTYTYAVAILSAPTVTLSFQGTAQAVNLSTSSGTTASITVDGIARVLPFSLEVAPNSTHTISAAAVQPGGNNPTQYYFNSWSDGGAATHAITSGTVDSVYTADFKTKFLLTTAAGTGGTINPVGGLYDAGVSVLVSATPANGYLFAAFNIGSVGRDGSNPIRITMNQPVDVSAVFTPLAQGSLHITLKPLHTMISGQLNAVFLARVVNEGTTVQNGVQVQFGGLAPIAFAGAGWTCSGSTCSRADALAPGQAYPALMITATVPEVSYASLNVGLTSNLSCPACMGLVTMPVYAPTNTLTGWGDGLSGQITAPNGITNIVDVAAGAEHTVAMLGTGKVVAWGDNTRLQTQVPGSLSNVVSVAAGGNHTLALVSNGQVVAWGDNRSGQTTVPGSLPAIVAVAAGQNHSLALTSAGAVVAWGANGSGQTTVPAAVQNAVAIAAGGDHSLALLRDGTVIAWGSNPDGESTVPANLAGVAAISAGTHYCTAVRGDGSVVVWGNNPASIQSGIPAGLADVQTLSAGSGHALALKWDGTLLAWGANPSGQATVPAGLSGITAIAAGAEHSVAVTSGPPAAPIVFSTLPVGAAYRVDGVAYTGDQTLQLTVGQHHTVTISPLPAQTIPGAEYTFQAWGDGYRGTTRTILPTGTNTFVLVYNARYKLTTAALPAAAGSIAVSPWSADGWYADNQLLQITAVPTAGNVFNTFTGDLNGNANPQYLNMSAPHSVTANFSAISSLPNAVSVTPSSGSGASGNFAAVYSAGLGYQNLAWVQLLIAAAPDGGGQPFCFLHYDVQGNRFWVYGDGGFFQGPVQPGVASALLQNTLCGLNTKTSTVTGSGTSLTFDAHVAFKAAASLSVYLRAQTLGQFDTGWVQRGIWTTGTTALGTMSVQPSAGSGSQQTFVLTYPDPVDFEDTTAGWSQFLVAAATDGGGLPFCFVHYDKAGNGLWMYSGDVGFFLGPVSPGTASNALDSSACSVNPGLATVTHPTGVVNVSVPVTMKPPMAGVRNLYQRTLDPLSRDSGWVKTGIWTVP
ncbi:InlB B-repeat-containing protein [Paludibaculum fermentans]|uniref:InlB B-repeat-containing protein n=1 Tax=Paludibaculum fermentans TaxID=1473598 RepID=UPI003EBB7546